MTAQTDDGKSGDDCIVVVGVGASAGGLEAYKRLLRTLPADAGIAYVLVQHLDPTHESLMVDLLSRHTDMPVTQVADETVVEGDHVYIIPPNKFLRMADGRLLLDPPETRRGVRLPIDHFFRSLAADCKERCVSVVLTGTGSDGAEGLREVKAAGGMTIAQAPDSAEYDGMPRSAISTGCVDRILDIEEMADVVVPYARHPYVRARPDATLAESAPDHFRAIVSLLRARTDLDLSRYKKGTLTRRIDRRMGIRHMSDPGEYLRLLRQDEDEVRALYGDVLIGVTNFFRETAAWDPFRAAVRSRIEASDGDETFRVWVPGCSTGEEAYSIAMVVFDEQERLNRRFDLQVFGTDVNAAAVQVARTGRYPESITKDLPEGYLDAYFNREGERLRVRKRLRESCIFAVQNLLSDPPFSNLDLVSCRNLLIYLEAGIQGRIFDMVHFALKPKGLLFLGSSESPGGRKRLFDTIDQGARLYRKRGSSAVGVAAFPVQPSGKQRRRTVGSPAGDDRTAVEMSKRALLEAFAPASVVVDPRGMIQYIHGPVRNYLDFPSGEPDLDLFSMANHGLKTKLRSAVHRAGHGSEGVSMLARRVRRDGGYGAVRIRAKRLPTSGAEPLFLVSFIDEGDTSERDAFSDGSGAELDLVDPDDLDLAVELQATREDLQSTIEELESSNEELKASNEEVMSMNEELQSTNEELETSREELQSLNEELTTVNNQLHDKVNELQETNDDLSNFLASTSIATLFLDSNLRIRRFTPATRQLMNLLDTDIGRPLGDLVSRVDDPTLEEDARDVLQELVPLEREARDRGGRDYIRRITPFRTSDDRIEGIVVTYVDVTQLKETTARVELRERQQSATANLGRAALAGLDLPSLLERVVHDIAAHLQVDFAKVLRLEEDGDFRLLAGVGWDEGLIGDARVPGGIDSQAGYTLETGGPVITWDLAQEKRFQGPQLLVDHEVASGMSVVIGPEEAPWGVLGAHTRDLVEFTVDDTHFMLSLANLIWEAIQREAKEAELRRKLAEIDAIYATAPIGLCFLDEELRFVRANETLAEMNGTTIAAHLGRQIAEVVPQLSDQLVPLLQNVLDSGNAAMDMEIRGPGPDGADEGGRAWIASYAPVLLDSEIIGINTAVIDITSRRRVEEALERAREEAEVASEAKSQFLANMSHEIRSPLTTILGVADLLRPRLEDEQDRALIERVKRNGDHLRQLLDDILDLSKIESGTIRVNREACDPVALLVQIVSLTTVRASGRDLTLALEFETPMPRSIDTDPRMVRQVLLNLVGNAIKFTETGGVRVVAACDPDARQLTISVVDSGTGIDPQRIESIFLPFEQGDNSSTRPVGGAGLGLAISRRLVEELGGEITVQSEPGVGSTFTVRLPTGPLDDVELVVPDAIVAAEDDSAPTSWDLERLEASILVVEDRQDIQLLLREFLEAIGCEIVTAGDGAEAVSLVNASDRFEAVLMDIQMPLMDGLEATRRLRSGGYERPIIALTAGVMEDEQQHARDAGCVDFVTKPIDPSELIRTLKEWLRPETSSAPTLRILLIEDNADVAEIQRLVLETDGHEVTTARTGDEALERLGEFQPEAVFVDLGLPGLSGDRLVAALRARLDPAVRVICLSGTAEDRVAWRKMGFDDYLQKPTKRENLRRILRQAAESSDVATGT